METNFDHNKLLKTIAKTRLKPHGITQQGSSRTFLYDGGWYVIMIEFQPSSFGKGSFLNIGVDLNFYPRDYIAFSYGYREKDFSAADSEVQFDEIVNNYCDQVIEKTQKLKEEFKNILTAIDTIQNRYLKDDPWDYYDLGVLYGLTGQTKKAELFLNKLKNLECTYDYEFERQKAAINIMNLLPDREKFLAGAKDLLAQSRQLKKLPVGDPQLLQTIYTLPKTSFLKSLFGKK
jgi:hypothetical protein